MSDSPPDRDLEWTESGADGAWRYLNRLWRLVNEPQTALPGPGTLPPADLGGALIEARKAIHKGIAGVTDDLDRFHFNKAVARIRELTNAIAPLDGSTEPGAGAVLREGIEAVVRLIAPITPHLAEELWLQLGYETPLVATPWPEADAALTVDDEITLAVQVNGKLRGTISLPRDAGKDQAEAAALALPAVEKLLEGRAPRKVIVVPNKVVNVVA